MILVPPSQDCAIGIDIGGSAAKITYLQADGTRGLSAREEIRDADNDGWLRSIRDVFENWQGKLHRPPKWVGLAAPGLVAEDGRSIGWMRGRLEAVQGLDWTHYLESPVTVRVLNDAHAALVGETWNGAAPGCRNAVLLTLGTGVGGAILSDGHLLRGHLGRAGHLGHISLNPDGPPDLVGAPGSLEGAIGECTLMARSGGRFRTTRRLLEAYEAGDTDAGKVWLRSVQLLACGIVSIINAVDPEFVILGGGIAQAGRHLFDPLDQFLAAMEWRPHGRRVAVVPAALGEFAGALGAARHAMTHGGNSPP